MMGIRIICLWPGLPAAWNRGLVPGTAIAILSCWVLSLLMLATFVWPEWVSVTVLRLSWTVAIVSWLAIVIWNHWTFRTLVATTDAKSIGEFEVAQAEYLRGDWFGAEARLLDILKDHPRDAEAMLLLVGVLRRTRRWQPALRRLQQLEALESASLWRFELIRERALIESLMLEAEQNIVAAGESTEGLGSEDTIDSSADADRPNIPKSTLAQDDNASLAITQ